MCLNERCPPEGGRYKIVWESGLPHRLFDLSGFDFANGKGREAALPGVQGEKPVLLRFCPRAEDGSHQAQSNERVELIDREQFLRSHLVHIGCEYNRPDNADPKQYADGRAAWRGIRISPQAQLRENER